MSSISNDTSLFYKKDEEWDRGFNIECVYVTYQ